MPDKQRYGRIGPGRFGWTGGIMLYWAAIFLIIAIVAAVFGFGGIAVAAADIARILFFIFVVLFVIALLVGLFTGRKPRV